jgi:hypothetical protein
LCQFKIPERDDLPDQLFEAAGHEASSQAMDRFQVIALRNLIGSSSPVYAVDRDASKAAHPSRVSSFSTGCSAQCCRTKES